jgi:hypothetical protein
VVGLNFTKTQFTNFTTKNKYQIEINIYYNYKFISYNYLYKISRFNWWLFTNTDLYWLTDKKK